MRHAYIGEVRGSRGWLIGWGFAAGVVLVAAGLLLTIIAQARTIARQVQEIDRSLERARSNTDSLFELGALNETIHKAVERLRAPGQRAKAG